jgi:hypothetical protein
MTQITSAAPQIKDALYQISVNLFQDDPQVLVSFGHPGTQTNSDLIAWLGIRTQQAEGPFSNSNRGREETVEVDVLVSSFRVGEADNDKVASDRAYSMLGQIENYVRTTDTTLGQLVRSCFLTSTSSHGATEPALIANGRTIDVLATFTAHVRITN